MNTFSPDAIKVLVWDFDSTLYAPQVELFTAVREAEFRVIMDHTGWSRKQASEEFYKRHKIITPSGTQVTANLAQIPVTQAAIETEAYFDRRNFLKKDMRLIGLFQKLTDYQHVLVPNGTKAKIAETLQVIGIPIVTFQAVITPEQTQVTKPNSKPFELALAFTKLPAASHLMIGDRIDVDLLPAKKLGMRTCWVTWKTAAVETNDLIDLVIPTVYELPQLLLPPAS